MNAVTPIRPNMDVRSLTDLTLELASTKVRFAAVQARMLDGGGTILAADDQLYSELEETIERREAECDALFRQITGVDWATYQRVRS